MKVALFPNFIVRFHSGTKVRFYAFSLETMLVELLITFSRLSASVARDPDA